MRRSERVESVKLCNLGPQVSGSSFHDFQKILLTFILNRDAPSGIAVL